MTFEIGVRPRRRSLSITALPPFDHYDLAPSGGESPHPNAQYGSDNKRDHAYPHRYLVSCDRYLCLFDQTNHVADGKKRENYTRDTQSRSLCTHRCILTSGYPFVSKNEASVLAARMSSYSRLTRP